HARGLDQPLEREAAVDEHLERTRAGEVELAELARVSRREREPARAPDRLERVEVDAGLLGDLLRRVQRGAAQRALCRQERQPALLDRRAELLDLAAVGVQRLQQSQ